MRVPFLPLLDSVARRSADWLSACGFGRDRWRSVYVVAYQHLLPTTASLVSNMRRVGIPSENIVVGGKCYSSNDEVVNYLSELCGYVQPGGRPDRVGRFYKSALLDCQRLWEEVAERTKGERCQILAIDDGGVLLATRPSGLESVVGVTQTAGGLFSKLGLKEVYGFPVINVASSWAKRRYESPFIAEAIVKASRERLGADAERDPVGVLGIGNLGVEVAAHLSQRPRSGQVYLYDSVTSLDMDGRLRDCSICDSLDELLERCKVIYGCVGQSVVRSDSPVWGGIKSPRYFVNCASGDEEFRSLAQSTRYIRSRKARTGDRFGDAEFRSPSDWGKIVLVRQGFPVNFDGCYEREPNRYIQLTRSLIFAAMAQAVSMTADEYRVGPGLHSLDDWLQHCIVSLWAGSVRHHHASIRDYGEKPQRQLRSGSHCRNEMEKAFRVSERV